jgi:hypothetical protein
LALRRAEERDREEVLRERVLAEVRRAREQVDSQVREAVRRARRLQGSRRASPESSERPLLGLLIWLFGALPQSLRRYHYELPCICEGS